MTDAPTVWDGTFAKTVRLLRAERDWTQHDLAKVAGVHYRTVQDLERGVRNSRLSTRVRIARALGINPTQMGGAA